MKILVYGWSGAWFAVDVIQSLDNIGHRFSKYELAPEAGQEFRRRVSFLVVQINRRDTNIIALQVCSQMVDDD